MSGFILNRKAPFAILMRESSFNIYVSLRVDNV